MNRNAGTIMSASRLVYLMIVPALIVTVVPMLAAMFDVVHWSAAALRFALLVSSTIVVFYAIGVAMLCRRDHRLITARLTKSHG